MTKSETQSTKIASYLLIIGGILALVPNLPVINETLSIFRYQITVLNSSISGGINFLGSYGNVSSALGNFSTTNKSNITGWTMLGLPGEILFAIFVLIGAAAIIVGLVIRKNPVLKLTGIVGGLIGLVMLILVYLGDSQSKNHFGLSNISLPNVYSIGYGFWVILLGCILILVAGLLVLKE